ncbi:hypothetical protein AOL_s00004g227 [Orbilia oligospora ATCC 24927]|uniref:Uncharacterized protein n=1 Tax=Arthrobotrys oligospora (strain ATCC 24927 / CBS 115.81 / DSM 1491) TaxID=756982 RepID=G1WY67_ARTOA|nr:hypothetical protein AOL_s00004g227 [Orbilia oligospora ATCC 24927]EGX54194.1 hypothetical protein AOL_s00004g227 [Orbilia oligospora ATCC 24927]
MAPFNIRSPGLSKQPWIFIIIFASAILGRPHDHPQPPAPGNTSHLENPKLPVYNTTIIPPICPSGGIEVCSDVGIANKNRLGLPTVSANLTIDAAQTTTSASHEATKTPIDLLETPINIEDIDLKKDTSTTTTVDKNNPKKLEPTSQKRLEVPAEFFYKAGTMEIYCPRGLESLKHARQFTTEPRMVDLEIWRIFDKPRWDRIVDLLRRATRADELLTPKIHKEVMPSILMGTEKCKRACCACSVELDSHKVPGSEYAHQDIYAFARAIERIPPQFRFRPVDDGYEVWDGWTVDESRRQVPGQRIRPSWNHMPLRSGLPPRYQNSGVLTPRQVAQLNQELVPPMYGSDGEELYTPEITPDPWATDYRRNVLLTLAAVPEYPRPPPYRGWFHDMSPPYSLDPPPGHQK